MGILIYLGLAIATSCLTLFLMLFILYCLDGEDSFIKTIKDKEEMMAIFWICVGFGAAWPLGLFLIAVTFAFFIVAGLFFKIYQFIMKKIFKIDVTIRDMLNG